MSDDSGHSGQKIKDRGQRGQRRPNAGAFLGHWQIWFVAIPAVATVCWLVNAGVRVATPPLRPGGHGGQLAIGLFDHTSGALIIWSVATVATLLAGLAIGHGLIVTKRVPFVLVHLAVSIWLTGILISVTTVVGWPLWWIIVYVAAASGLALSWNLPRSDALRSDPRGESEDSAGKLLGTRARFGQPRVDDYAIRASVKPALGETMDDVAKTAAKIAEAHPDGLPSRTRLEVDPRTGRGEMVIQHTDPLEPWPAWRGPSNFGGSYELGARAGRYEDGTDEWIYFAERMVDPKDPTKNTMPGHLGTMGMSRSGKSGAAKIRWADLVFTRADAWMIYCDCASPEQSMAADVMADLELYADTPAKIKRVFQALMRLARYRGRTLKAAGFENWSHAAFEATGLAAVHVAVDEADKVIGADWYTDVVTTVLKAGIYVDTILPRADAASMPSGGRFSIAAWLVFGTGDTYSHDFVIPDTLVNARPDLWRNTRPGYHYPIMLPGQDTRQLGMVARSEYATNAEVAAWAERGRAFRAHATAGEIEAIGKVWADCRPVTDPFAEDDVIPARAATEAALFRHRVRVRTTDKDGDEMDEQDETGEPSVADELELTPEERAELAAADPRAPIEHPTGPADDFTEGDDRPAAPSVEAAREAMDMVLRGMAGEGITEFGNADVIARYPYRSATSTMSERMSKICDGEYVKPPGLTINRLGKGRYEIIRDPSSVIDAEPVGFKV